MLENFQKIRNRDGEGGQVVKSKGEISGLHALNWAEDIWKAADRADHTSSRKRTAGTEDSKVLRRDEILPTTQREAIFDVDGTKGWSTTETLRSDREGRKGADLRMPAGIEDDRTAMIPTAGGDHRSHPEK